MQFLISRLSRRTRRPLLVGLALFSTYLLSVSRAATGTEGRLKLIFDDYYQKDRSGHPFTQGVALEPAFRSLTNFYSPDANAIPNGTFVLSHVLADKFQVTVGDQPLSEDLLRSTDVYMLVSPVKRESGGRAALTEREADLLEAFVARGGRLVLILNSVTDPKKADFDLAGVNGIARRFGVEFLAVQTGTMSIPVPKDHPLFDGVDAVIFGNGTHLRILSGADPRSVVVLKDPREGHGQAPVGVIAPFKQGRVLLFGDGGTFGNAHLLRHDVDQAKAVRQIFEGLLPDGPAPAYGWKEGQRLKVRVMHEQVISAYPHGNRLMNLPKAKGTELVLTEARSLDLDASPEKKAAAQTSRYASAILKKETSFRLEMGASDGSASAAIWRSETGEAMTCRVLPKGRILDAAPAPNDDFAAWGWALLGELICSPLKASARPGETWEADIMVPLPHAQLSPVPIMTSAKATIRFEGETTYRGRPCFLFTRLTSIDASAWRLQDIVSPAAVAQFGPDQIGLMTGGLMASSSFWVDRESLLPVRTEVRIASGIWYKDAAFPDRYEGSHDWRNFENWREINFIATLGRVLTADFERE